MQALVIIDMQRWMFRKAKRELQLPHLVPRINRLAAAFDAAGLPVFDVRTYLKADRSNWTRMMRKHDSAVMIEGSQDVEPVDGLKIPNRAQRVRKTRNSAFLGTDFDERLRGADVDHFALCGVFIEGCVGLTGAEAEQRDYEVTLIDDAIGHADPSNRPVFFNWMNQYESNVVSTEEALSWLENLTQASN